MKYFTKITILALLLVVSRTSFAQVAGEKSISGTINSLTVSADHANVKSLLLAVFKQVGMQFIPNDTVKGEVTLNIVNANLNSVLKDICDEDALTYTVDDKGVYRFTQNVAAMRARLFAQRTNGMLLLRQLKQFGYNVSAPIIMTPQSGQTEAVKALSPWDLMMRNNGTVGVDIPAGKPIPMYQVLQAFSRQSGVPITVDPAIERNPTFRIDGHIVRPLPQALQLLGQVSHLTIVRTATGYFVTPAPDFKIFYGRSNAPRASFP